MAEDIVKERSSESEGQGLLKLETGLLKLALPPKDSPNYRHTRDSLGFLFLQPPPRIINCKDH